MATPSADGLLQQVTARLRINQWVQAVSYWGLVWCGLSLALLVASRCLGLIPGWVNGWAVAAVPVVSALGAWLLLRPLGTDRAARQIDRHGNTKDLFLTYAALDTTVGGYQPIVVSQAEQAATRIKPELAVPITCGKAARYALALFLGLVMGFLFLPQWDPFGRVAAVTEQQLQRKQLEQERQATRTRIAQIKQDTTESAVKSPAESSIDELKRALQQMRPTEQQANREKLQVHQSQVGKQWKQLGAEKLKSLLQQGGESLQDFGGSRMQKMEKWTEQLKNGDTQMIRQEIKDLADLARQIAEAKDPVQQAELQREMKERLKDLERFAAERAGSPEAAAAVRRAMRQMEQAAKEGMDPQALQDLAESLELSQMEMQQLAEAAKDLQQLEKALKTMKMAKQVNEDGKLDGEACQACQTLDDYAQLYQQMMADGNAMNGEGTGGEGQGKGGKVDENDAINTAFKEETSKSAIRAGKSLLSMKTRGESDEGVANKEYQEQVERVRQSVSEAILQEQIPPGYHESIRAFFQQDNSDGPSDPASSNPVDAAASEPVPSSNADSP